jgi:SAM-dependent methyltransferase
MNDGTPPVPDTPGADPAQLTAVTIGHYEREAEAYREGTWNHDVSQNRAALLAAMEGQRPFHILDFGCGPGRDLVYFRSLGHRVTGVDGSAAFVEMAHTRSGCEVLHQDFIALDLPAACFDGIFANASLFHVPRARLPQVLARLHASLRPRGVLFCSNPRGENQEGFNGDRYGAFYNLASWRTLLTAAGFVEIDHYYRPPGLPRHQQPWLATVWRRP